MVEGLNISLHPGAGVMWFKKLLHDEVKPVNLIDSSVGEEMSGSGDITIGLSSEEEGGLALPNSSAREVRKVILLTSCRAWKGVNGTER